MTTDQDDTSSGLSTAACLSHKRVELPLAASGWTPTFATIYETTSPPSYASSPHDLTSGGMSGLYGSGSVPSSTVEDLTAALREIVSEADFGNAHRQSSASRPQRRYGPVQPHLGAPPLLQAPDHSFQPHQGRSVSAHALSPGHLAYGFYTGVPARDGQDSYDAIWGGPDPVHAFPLFQAHDTRSQQSAYSVLPSLSAPMHPSGVLYDLTSTACLSTSQNYYAALQHPAYYPPASPQSPVQLVEVSPFPPGLRHDQKREIEVSALDEDDSDRF